jgi:hypothetical protein
MGLVSYHVLVALFVASPIGQFYRCSLEFASCRNVNVILLKWSPLGEDWVHWRLWIGWIFKVGLRDALLRLRT